MSMSPRLLRPRQTLHPEAASWASRVVANGGAVSGGTLSAVDKFVKACYANNIRDRFYRLNLFAGSFQGAFVPLFRGPSLGGTQYGNATDTNNAFVGIGTDYAETGATSGLTGNGSTKSLNTGLKANVLTASDSHMGFGLRATQTGAAAYRALGGAFSGGSNTFEMSVRRSDANEHCFFTRFGTATDRAGEAVQSSSLAVGDVMMAYPSFYRNGSATGATASTSQDYPSAHDIFIFALGVGSAVPGNFTDSRMNWYSIGRTMTSGQVLSYYNALAAFNSALTRT